MSTHINHPLRYSQLSDMPIKVWNNHLLIWSEEWDHLSVTLDPKYHSSWERISDGERFTTPLIGTEYA